ncbi:SDR family oxidoreductase [Shewanella sp. SW36]|uniref:dTDP-4-dehydrorhamnose reductase family protein n=1 Tax=Shewanella TaxID=22 RepID=UPI0021D8015E|nr:MULTISPECIES: SDR family oxidoreductase [unclassified Shewanella]MCU7975140.1 SDR family oxidoreductase [Shewanella sp. SW36]MCU7990529.1 SDR family oxidoreductase [Shewanella sp. SW1]MCU8016196.1 SDR family oxidoreductase [Shewanella sp. SM72]MCU8051734.1 SDR family oxidoreductase [Shewanella sp. SM43]
MAKIMVTGATGLLGRAVVKQLELTGHEIIATGFSRASERVHKLDLTAPLDVEAFIAREQPQVIVHCAAERRPDVSEQNPQAALALNLTASQALAMAAKANNAWLIYISTDYVFDGTQPKYAEDAATHPVNFYGESKLKGEEIVLDTSADFAVLRLPILYGQVEKLSESAVLVLVNQLIERRAQGVDHWAIRSPTSTADIAQAIDKMIAQHIEHSTVQGIYHFSAVETMTKYQMLLTLGDILQLSTAHLTPESTPTDNAKRPRDCTLSCARLAAMGICSEINFATGVRQALTQSSGALATLGLTL